MFELRPEDYTLTNPGPGKGGWVRLVLFEGSLFFAAGAAVLEAEPQLPD